MCPYFWLALKNSGTLRVYAAFPKWEELSILISRDVKIILHRFIFDAHLAHSWLIRRLAHWSECMYLQGIKDRIFICYVLLNI